MTRNLGVLLSGLPVEIVRLEIIERIGPLSMMVVRHALLGHSVITGGFCIDEDVYLYGIEFFLWCWRNMQLLHVGFCAGRSGDMSIVAWAIQNGFTNNLCNGCAVGGSLECIEYAVKHGCFCNAGLLRCVVAYDRLDQLIWLYRKAQPNRDYVKWNGAFRVAIDRNSEHCARWMVTRGVSREISVCAMAAASGNLTCLMWLRKNGFVCNKITFAAAARNGQLEIVKYLHETGCSWDNCAHKNAIANEHQDVVEYLQLHGLC